MKLIAFALAGVATLAGVIALTAPAANQENAPIFVTDIPPGYRDSSRSFTADCHPRGWHSLSSCLRNLRALRGR